MGYVVNNLIDCYCFIIFSVRMVPSVIKIDAMYNPVGCEEISTVSEYDPI